MLTPLRNDDVSAEISTAPASAVPIEAPRFVIVFCTPPTSPLCSSGTDETVTLPNWDASAPTPSPASSIGQVTISGPGTGVERGHHDHDAGEQRGEPDLHDPARGGVREQLGHPDRRQQQRDRQRQQPDAGRDRRKPQRDRQEQRHHEEEPGLQKVLEEERAEPAAQASGSAAAPGRPAARPPGRRAGSPTTGRATARPPPARISQITGDSPSQAGAPSLGWMNPQVPERRMP